MHGPPAGEEAEICHGRGMYLSSFITLQDTNANNVKGYPEDLVVAVALGADMFDCVWPTRTAVSVHISQTALDCESNTDSDSETPSSPPEISTSATKPLQKTLGLWKKGAHAPPAGPSQKAAWGLAELTSITWLPRRLLGLTCTIYPCLHTCLAQADIT